MVVVAAIVLTSAIGASVVSNFLWGYWLHEPRSDPRLGQINKITARSVVAIYYDDNGSIEVSRSFSDDGYTEEPIESADLIAISVTLQRELRGDIRRSVYSVLTGSAIQYVTRDGQPLTAMWLSSGPITDERFLDCELLLSRPDVGEPRLLWTRRTYVMEGLEGLNWGALFAVFGGAQLVVALLFAGLVMLWKYVRHRRGVARGFEVMVR